jgi:Zn-dependent M28 family amino/carboxypeptidase
VIALARYYTQTHDNQRTLVFATFAAEERGMIGSRQLVKELPFPAERIVAVINFEMIGKSRENGELRCYLTGWDRSDMGTIMQKSLGENASWLQRGPEITDRLFFASDNISFARAGVVAHTLAGFNSTNDPMTHTPGDEYDTCNVKDMTQIIRGIVKAAESIISGMSTPVMLEPVPSRNKIP